MSTTTKQTVISKDLSNKKLFIEREFNAPLAAVWRAWTESSLLDQWWAPKPWKAVTESMDFRAGGFWLYYMLGPDGTRQYCRADYKTIDPNRSFTLTDAFCDENGTPNSDIASIHWQNKFSETESGTKVEVEVTFQSEADLEKIIEMGFEEGFTAAQTNLDELLQGEMLSSQ